MSIIPMDTSSCSSSNNGFLPSASAMAQALLQVEQLRKENEAKNLILRAWRERWSDKEWGIHVKTLMGTADYDLSYIADCILQQALNGPGPNTLVLSYLKHSVFSHVIKSSAVLKSISQYQFFYKQFCVTSLLDLLDQIKDRIITSIIETPEQSLELSLSLQATIYWLLSCMYSSLENLSDMPDVSELQVEVEDSKIVNKCKSLLDYFLNEKFIKSLLYIATIHDPDLHEKIQQMSRENLKVADAHHSSDITLIMSHVDQLSNFREDLSELESQCVPIIVSYDQRCAQIVNGRVHTTVMIGALIRNFSEMQTVASDLMIIKQLLNMSSPALYCELIHSTMIGLAESAGKETELKFIGFAFLQLPQLFHMIQEKSQDTAEEISQGLELFLNNEGALDVVDSKLHCSTWELFLSSLQKYPLLNENQKKYFLSKRSSSNTLLNQNSSNAVLILKAETTLLSILKTLDGDYAKCQDAMQNVLSDMVGKSFEFILTAASATGKLQQLTSKLIKLNQFSRQVNGEGGKASTTRSLIFDTSFLMLCHIVQNYGPQSLSSEEPDCFFEEWYRESMVVENVVKNPDAIIARCDQTKVDVLLNQYMQGDTDLKTSLVFWHEMCTNSVGVVRELLLAWTCNAVSVLDVKKILDVFRSRMCSLSVCIGAWLCSYIQIMPEEQCGRARYMLEHLISPSPVPTTPDETADNFKDRRNIMNKIISKMTVTSQTAQPSDCITDTKDSKELFQTCWKNMSNRGILDGCAILQLKNLLEISGPTQFVYLCVQQLYEVQHKMELAQWKDLLYGILHIDLQKCFECLLSVVLPNLLHYPQSYPSSAEPQAIALVSLTVDMVISYYLHSKLSIKEDLYEEFDEPAAKRRRLVSSNSDSHSLLVTILKEFFDDIEQALMISNDYSPVARFIFRFLNEFAFKTPNLSLLHSISPSVIEQLMIAVGDNITTQFILSLYSLEDPFGRANCAQAICNFHNLKDEMET